MQSLREGSLLQGGKYRIERTLGQGGFGITYAAVQAALNRRVAIKEFFMKEYCERDGDTSHITLGTAGSKEVVGRFREKFLKEAALIAQFDNPHIVRIYDIFEENGTAYYVMEFLEDRWHQFGEGGLPWELSLNIIRQVGDGLSYIHAQNVLHLDVKPSNILFRKDQAVLIDFGISKRYDAAGGQTSSTPVGISKGYAPLEQYNQGVQKFQPATDVYSLGATLYKLLTGETPPEASDVMNYGLPTTYLQARNVPQHIITAIQKSMEPRVGQRYQSVSSFFDAIGDIPHTTTWKKTDAREHTKEETTIIQNPPKEKEVKVREKKTGNKGKLKKYVMCVAALAAIAVPVTFILMPQGNKTMETTELKNIEDSLAYAIGMAQSEGLKEYLESKMQIDTTRMKEFKEGLLYGAGLKKGSYPDFDGESQKAFNGGIEIGTQIRQQMIPGINKEVYGDSSVKTISQPRLMDGFIDGIDRDYSVFDIETAQEVSQHLMSSIKRSCQEKEYGENKRAGEEFLNKNKNKEGVHILPSGVQYKIITQGTGKKPTEESTVTVNYEGRLIDGTIFDSSYERGNPASFRCNQVIPGWTEVLTHMPVGSLWEVYIPQDLAYGEREMGTIKPFSMLILKIDLISCD